MASMKAVGSIFSSVQNTLKASSGSAVNIVICLVTVGSEQLFSFAAFSCPCPGNSTTGAGVQQNYLYGWVFIVVPALALFVLGYAMNIKTWKIMTGCCSRNERASRGAIAVCSTMLEICVQALVAPVAWMSVAFLDGKYYACAATVNPYLKSCTDVITKKLTTFTQEYDENKRQSQIIGWCLVAFTLLLGSIFYTVHRCLSPLTYHHRKYARWYREMESKAFEDKAKAQIKAEVENETVQRFLQKKRNKFDWDKISTVFNFTRDKKNFALYSRLDEWNEKQKLIEPLPGEIEVANEAKEDDFSLEKDKNTTNNNAVSIFPNPTYISKDKTIEMQPIPKIPPPPSNKNTGKRRLSSSGFEDDASNVTSRMTPDMTSQQPSNTPDKAATRQSPDEMTSQNIQAMTSLPRRSSLYENDDTERSDLLKQKYKSMPDIPSDVKVKLTNGKVHVKAARSMKAPSYEDEDDSGV